jgi:hypothetical protein
LEAQQVQQALAPEEEEEEEEEEESVGRVFFSWYKICK